MYIEKLPSGNYRITQTKDGKKYRVTVDYKPTKTEAQLIIDEKIAECSPQFTNDSFGGVAMKYISVKEHTLSPKTVKEYKKLVNNSLPQWFVEMNFNEIDQEKVQICVNEMSMTLAPKTVKDRHSFIASVLGLYKPSMKLRTNLPKLVKTEPLVPSEESVKAVLKYFKEKEPKYYIPVLLGTYSMRRSEICALTSNDVEGNILHINKALVQDEHNNWVVKGTKTTMSTRDIVIPQDIADLIRLQGYVYMGDPQTLNRALLRVEKMLGLETFSFHKLRHYFVAKMLELGYDMRTIQEWGGWDGDDTVKKIYAYSLTMKSQDRRNEISEALSRGII